MGKKLTTEIFIERSKNIHGDKYDYSLSVYKNNKTKILIICKTHGEFHQLPINHINAKSGCYKCCGNSALTTDSFIEKSIVIHNDKYDYSSVEYVNTKTPVVIICKKHGEFKQTPNVHLSKHGCPTCGNKMDINILKERCHIIYGDLYDYTDTIYNGVEETINIICKKHGEVCVKTSNFLYRKSGCKYCANNSYKDISYFILDANKTHNNKYEYKVLDNLKKDSYIEILCDIHGTFKQRIRSHIYDGIGCSKCSDDNRRKSVNLLLTQFKEKHDSLYDYANVEYINTNTKVDIICHKHGIFKQSPKRHLYGDGCPSCNESKGEKEIFMFLTENNIKFEREKKFSNCISDRNKKLRFDFYIPSKNICIEYDGEQHFEMNEYFGGNDAFELTKRNDLLKNIYCSDNNIRLIRIAFYEYDKIKYILTNNLL